MPDVRAVQETIQFQAGSPASITVTARDTDGDPVDVTGLTFVVALRPTGTIIATTLDPEAGTRVFSLTGENTTAIAAGGGLYSIADGDAEWIVGTARASTEGTKAQDHTLSVTVGAAQINVEVSAAIGGGGASGPSGSLPIAARVATPVSNLGGSVGSGVATIPPFAAMSAGQLVWLTAQASGADDGFYVHGSGGVFTVTTDYIDAAYLGWIIAVGTDLDTGTATAYVVRNDGSGILTERVSLTPGQLTTALGGYATSSALSSLAGTVAGKADVAAVAAKADRSALEVVRVRSAAAVGAGITRVFRCTGDPSGRWATPNPGAFTTGYEFRCLRIPRRPTTIPYYSEMGTQPRDGGAGSHDNHEVADVAVDETFLVDGEPLVHGKPYLFIEISDGETDGSGLFVDVGLEWGNPIETMTDIVFAETRARHWLRVPYELEDGATYHTSSIDGAVFRLMGSVVAPRWGSIGAWSEEWWLGQNYYGDIARASWRDGLDGDLIADPDASTVEPGATSFVDGAGNTWTAGAAARVVDLTDMFEPAAPADWLSVPSTRSAALDELAARLAAIEP